MSLLNALQNPDLYDHPVSDFEVIETHISWVLLTGTYAYKIKKPVDFGVINFSTLDKRKFYCEEEVRLNRRLAPRLYIGVVKICGSEQQPRLNTDAPAIEYAVKMHQFPQQAQLDRILAVQGLTHHQVDELAGIIAGFHQSIDVIEKSLPFGDPEHIAQPVQENFSQIRKLQHDKHIEQILEHISQWSEQQLKTLEQVFIQRKQTGFVRECHGDMHLRNMALIENEIVIFDCIEFNKNFYLIDVMSELAFLVMDLEDRQHAGLANRLLNKYLEITGDYNGLRVFNFYKVYRAMVRAKVDALRCLQEQPGKKEYKSTYRDFTQYLQLANRYTEPVQPCLIINHGLSGSGKTMGAYQLLEQLPLIILRSDIERKRIYDSETQTASSNEIDKGMYSQDMTEKTYARLEQLAAQLLDEGYSVVIDAANLKTLQRQRFIDLANTKVCPCLIMDYQSNIATLKQRIKKRAKAGQDASDATVQVLEHQVKTRQPLSASELDRTITIDSDKNPDPNALTRAIRDRLCFDNI